MAAKCVVCGTDLHCRVEPCGHGESVAWYCPERVIESLRAEVDRLKEYYEADVEYCAVRFLRRIKRASMEELKTSFTRKREAKRRMEETNLSLDGTMK